MMEVINDLTARLLSNRDRDREAFRRAAFTFFFWMIAVCMLLSALLTTMLLIVIPMFELENEEWNRPDNPHTIANVLLHIAAGLVAIYAARSSDRTRVVIVVLFYAIGVVFALRDVGIYLF